MVTKERIKKEIKEWAQVMLGAAIGAYLALMVIYQMLITPID